jgi:hypothetical protein
VYTGLFISVVKQGEPDDFGDAGARPRRELQTITELTSDGRYQFFPGLLVVTEDGLADKSKSKPRTRS